MERVILHCDCNSFYASCESVINPKLKEVPMAVCGDPKNRHGIILAKNELAKKYGIETTETVYSAMRKCPELCLVQPHHSLYEEFSRKCNAIYREYTDLTEPFGIDESWLDVTASRLLFGTGEKIANRIRQRFKDELGLTCSVGVSFNKSIAKLASDYKKPDATTVITRENFREKVWCLPVSALLFAGKKTVDKLRTMDIFTIGDLAQSDRNKIVKHLGKSGDILYCYANGTDNSPVTPSSEKGEQKSVSCASTFRRDLVSAEDIKKATNLLCNELSYRLRQSGAKCRNVTVTVKYFDFTSVSKRKTYADYTDIPKILYDRASEIIFSALSPKNPIRTLTVSASDLIFSRDGLQLSMFEENTKLSSLENTLDSIREKYGSASVKLASFLDSDL